MKNSIENNFKQSLANHEMPYNADAWTALQSKLDAKMPVASKPKSNFKYYAAASTIVVLTVASIYIFGDNNVKSTENENIAQNENVVISQESTTNDEVNSNTVKNNNAVTNNIESVTNEVPSDNQVNANVVSNTPTDGGTPITNSNNNSNQNNTIENSNNTNNANSNENNNQVVVAAASYKIPSIADVCEGSTFNVKNTNNVPLVIEGPELQFIVPANSSRTVRTKADGVHTIGLVNPNPEFPNKTFNVLNAPNVDFNIDMENKFENGLPTTEVEAAVNAVNYEWYYNNVKSTGRKANIHLYKKGDHDVLLTVTALNGCENSLTKTIYVEEKYNLMAVNSFIPTDTDPRNNRFMPFALTQRNVQFTMIIIDPTDGHIVFQTNNASNGWDGTDSANGQPVSYEKSYIWKVVLDNPATNEDNEYIGNIVPIRSRQ